MKSKSVPHWMNMRNEINKYETWGALNLKYDGDEWGRCVIYGRGDDVMMVERCCCRCGKVAYEETRQWMVSVDVAANATCLAFPWNRGWPLASPEEMIRPCGTMLKPKSPNPPISRLWGQNGPFIIKIINPSHLKLIFKMTSLVPCH